MRPRLLPAVLLAGLLAACGDTAPAVSPSLNKEPVTDGDTARLDLAARAALAQDFRFSALYSWKSDGDEARSVVATVATDGSWRVDIPGGALGGTADVSVVQTGEGVFQCALPSATNPVNPSCVRVADPNKRVPDRYDPKIERVFRQWLPVFMDRQAPLAVTAARPLTDAPGQCYAVDGISASLKAPLDVGIYCYAENGLLTAARVAFGTITLSGTPAAAPAKVDLPGPVTGGEAMGMDAPPPPPPPPSPTSLDPSAPTG